jgi:hypothetical protein
MRHLSVPLATPRRQRWRPASAVSAHPSMGGRSSPSWRDGDHWWASTQDSQALSWSAPGENILSPSPRSRRSVFSGKVVKACEDRGLFVDVLLAYAELPAHMGIEAGRRFEFLLEGEAVAHSPFDITIHPRSLRTIGNGRSSPEAAVVSCGSPYRGVDFGGSPPRQLGVVGFGLRGGLEQKTGLRTGGPKAAERLRRGDPPSGVPQEPWRRGHGAALPEPEGLER